MGRSTRIFFPIFFILILWSQLPQAALAQGLTPLPSQATPTVTASATSGLQPQPSEGISDPLDGSVIGGEVVVSGTSNSGWILAFTFAEDSVATWFQLAQSQLPIENNTLAKWDTRNVSDGNYLLRLTILAPGESKYSTIKIRVSNKFATPTGTPPLVTTVTPTPTPSVVTVVITNTPKSNLSINDPPLATPIILLSTTVESQTTPTTIILRQNDLTLPRNPASLDQSEIVTMLARSFIIVSVVFGLVSLVFFLRKK